MATLNLQAMLARRILRPRINLDVMNDATVPSACGGLCEFVAGPRLGHPVVMITSAFIDSLSQVSQTLNQKIQAGSICMDEDLLVVIRHETQEMILVAHFTLQAERPGSGTDAAKFCGRTAAVTCRRMFGRLSGTGFIWERLLSHKTRRKDLRFHRI